MAWSMEWYGIARVNSLSVAKPDASEVTRLEKMPFSCELELVRNGIINTEIIAASIWTINDMLSSESKKK